MAAKLEWINVSLMLGPIRVGQLTITARHWHYQIPLGERSMFESVGYENGKDARQDCEAEVRRLLKEAGVEVEP